MAETKGNYKAEQIKVLEGLEGVRRRPAMYIGGTGKDGLHHCVYEVVDNSIDEALAGHADNVEIIIHKDGSLSVSDNGRGIPVDIHPKFKKPALEIALTKLHAGGKFEKSAYEISGGLHGVGVSCVNALSKKLIATVCRNGKKHQQEYKIGKPVYNMKTIGKCDKNEQGTTIRFWPDKEIFSTLEFDFNYLKKRLQELAFLNPIIKIILKDEKNNKKEIFHYEGGLMEFVKHINKSKSPLHKPIYFKREDNGNIVEVAIQYTDGYNENIFGFVNTINTTEGGTHISGFKTALTRAINDYSNKKGLLKNVKIEGNDVREGITSIISLKMKEPQFEGQTKTKLGNSDMKGIVDSMVYIALGEFLEENPNVANKIAQKAIASSKARSAAKKARDLVRRKSAIGGLSGLPGKLADCSSKKTEKTEMYIVEGDSAGGSAIQARDSSFQAILPLKGKILNVEKSNPTRALSSDEIVNLITAIGTQVKENFNLDKLRYNKIIIMSVDGEEATFIKSPNGKVSFVKIGEFIDSIIEKNINLTNYEVLCFGLKSRKTQFKPIKTVIKHPIREKLYEIKTSYGRNVKVTSSHSVFVFENERVKLKKGCEIQKGDKIVAPKNLPLYNYNPLSKLDVLSLFINLKGKIKEDIYIRGKEVEDLLKIKVRKSYEDNNEFIDNRIIISRDFGDFLIKKRKEKKLSQKFMCENLGVKQPCVYYDWEKGKSKPSLSNFKKYLKLLEINKEQGLSQVQVVESKLDNVWKNQYRNSGRNKVKDYVNLKNLEKEDLNCLSNIKICSTHYGFKGINRYVNVNNNLMTLMGFWVAEGSCSLRNGVRVAIGNNNEVFVPELKVAFEDVFGLNAKLSKSKNRCSELKLVNRAGSLFWQTLFRSSRYSSVTKKIPDLVFNLTKEMQLEFLRGYFLGDGTISRNGISFTTVSKDLANQLMYLFQAHGVVAGKSVREPLKNDKITSRHLVYTISITSREDLRILKRVWESHRNAHYLDKKLSSKVPSMNRKFKQISDDLITLDVIDFKEVKASNGQVYDFSVDEDENFIAGMGGLCCHNTDADVDGSHIRTLLLTFFFRYMPELIENGNVFVAVSPLYRIRKKKDYYVYSDDELKKITSKLGGNPDVQRFKGLGEMNPTQLWDTTMNPKTRILKKVNIEDAVIADETFSMLMGDVVAPRRKFIEMNANIAEVDI